MADHANVCERVQQVLIESLNVDEDEVKPAASLRDDLGAESIDFLDIVFRLEREFDIKIPRGELFPESIFQGDPELVQDGQVTDRGVELLRERMPFADLSGFDSDRRLTAVSDMFTVDLINRYVNWKLHQPERAEAAPTAVSA
ncbi:MAG TPA: acyl carrier protein [Gemmataceae bacterium]|nr:acyl carrier protein [Gemmataceae bacterium]